MKHATFIFITQNLCHFLRLYSQAKLDMHSQNKLQSDCTEDTVPCVALFEQNRDNKTFTKHMNSNTKKIAIHVLACNSQKMFCAVRAVTIFSAMCFYNIVVFLQNQPKRSEGPLIKSGEHDVNVFQLKTSMFIWVLSWTQHHLQCNCRIYAGSGTGFVI